MTILFRSIYWYDILVEFTDLGSEFKETIASINSYLIVLASYPNILERCSSPSSTKLQCWRRLCSLRQNDALSGFVTKFWFNFFNHFPHCNITAMFLLLALLFFLFLYFLIFFWSMGGCGSQLYLFLFVQCRIKE